MPPNLLSAMHVVMHALHTPCSSWHSHQENLCWLCQRVTLGHSWAWSFSPVLESSVTCLLKASEHSGMFPSLSWESREAEASRDWPQVKPLLAPSGGHGASAFKAHGVCLLPQNINVGWITGKTSFWLYRVSCQPLCTCVCWVTLREEGDRTWSKAMWSQGEIWLENDENCSCGI